MIDERTHKKGGSADPLSPHERRERGPDEALKIDSPPLIEFNEAPAGVHVLLIRDGMYFVHQPRKAFCFLAKERAEERHRKA